MSEIFLNIVNMSITASWVVIAVLLLRILLKKAPKWITVLLWGIVAVRLICPFTFESVMSLLPVRETITPSSMTAKIPGINTESPILNNTVVPAISSMISTEPSKITDPSELLVPILTRIWCVGIFLMLIYTAVSFLRVKKKIGAAVLLRDNIYGSETVVSPFVMGIVDPKIYLPFHIGEKDRECVIAHEQAHIRRRDHWWKPLGFLLLAFHWFNPLLWLGYILLCRDIELACDEKVIKGLDREHIANYSQALLNCSVNRRMIAACPLAFGEVGVKSRVKSVLSYKKPAFWIILVAILASIAAAVCFLTDPASAKLKNIEGLTLESLPEETVSVVVSENGKEYGADAVDQDQLQALLNLKISRGEVSRNRSEDRDTSYTLILQTEPDTNGLYIHFNADFTSVWVDTGIKPTLSYRVKDPEKASEIYWRIAPTTYIEKVAGDECGSSIDVDLLKATYPMYFDLDTTKGLTVCVWQMAANDYRCCLASGKNIGYSTIGEEIWELQLTAATSMNAMRAIVASYLYDGKITRDDVTICPTAAPHSSYSGTVDDDHLQKLNDLFWSGIWDDFTYLDIHLQPNPDTEVEMVPTDVTSVKIFEPYIYVQLDGKTYRYEHLYTNPWSMTVGELLYTIPRGDFDWKVYALEEIPDHRIVYVTARDAYVDMYEYSPPKAVDPEALQAAKESGCVVMENGVCTSGAARWKEFYETVQKGKPCTVRLARYYTLDPASCSKQLYEVSKEDYPAMYVYDLTYDGGCFTVKWNERGKPMVEQYEYLMKYENAGLPNLPGSEKTEYVLTHSDTVPWDKLIWTYFSSSLDYITDERLEHFRAFAER